MLAAQILHGRSSIQKQHYASASEDWNLVQQVSSAKLGGTAHGGRIVLERPTGWKQLLNAII